MSNDFPNLIEETSHKLERKKRSLLYYIMVGVFLFNVLALLLFGSVAIFTHIFKREVAFQPGPEIIKTIDPRKLEHKVKVKEMQKNSGRPKVQPRLQANRVANIALPSIDVETDMVKDTLQKNMVKTFASAGLGTGLGTGSGSGGLGLGASKVSFFGIQAAGERIVFIIDVSRSMVEDIRGGLPGFDILKSEVGTMVEKLNHGTFFNMVTFDSRVDIFKPKLELANNDLKKEANKFMSPYFEGFAAKIKEGFASGKFVMPNATRLGNYHPRVTESLTKFVWAGFDAESSTFGTGTSRMDLALMAAFEMKADAIFVISDGNPWIYRALVGKELEEFEKLRKKVEDQAMKSPQRREEQEKKRFQEREAENKKRLRRGLPPKVIERYGVGGSRPPKLTHAEVLEYLRAFMIEMYGDDSKNYPRIYAVAYGSDAGEEAFLRELAKEYRGRFRKINGLAPPIK